jgi:tetratricopeptide (TPR) repeat protein
VSLINKVLSDLEERQSLAANSQGVILDGLEAVAEEKLPGNRITGVMQWTMLLLLLLFLAAYTFLPGRNIISEPPAAPGMTAAPTAEAEVAERRDTPLDPGPAGQAGPGASLNSMKLDYSLSISTQAVAAARQDTAGNLTVQSAAGDSPVEIQDISLSDSGSGPVLNLRATGRVSYTTYALENPDRIVVELYGAGLNTELPAVTHGSGITRIRTRQLPGDTLLIILETESVLSFRTIDNLEDNGHLISIRLQGNVSPAAVDPDMAPTTMLPEHAAADIPEVSDWGDMQVRKASVNPVNKSGKLVQEALQLYRKGQHESANAKMAEVMELAPDNIAARSLFAAKLLEQHRFEAAAKLLEQGLQQRPGTTEWIKIYARILVDHGDEQAAIGLLHDGLPDVAEDPGYHAFLAALYQRQARHADAVQVYHQVLGIHPENGVWWMGLAISLEAMDRNREALEAYQRAFEIRQDSPDIYRFLEQKIARLKKVPA